MSSQHGALSFILFVRFIPSVQHCAAHTTAYWGKITTKGEKDCCLSMVCSKNAKADFWKKNCYGKLFPITHTSISPSYSAVSSRVTLKGVVLSRLEPFWGDLRFLLGDVLSDMSSVSLCSSRYLEFCSWKSKKGSQMDIQCHLSALIPEWKFKTVIILWSTALVSRQRLKIKFVDYNGLRESQWCGVSTEALCWIAVCKLF